jgi:hypothetical protein
MFYQTSFVVISLRQTAQWKKKRTRNVALWPICLIRHSKKKAHSRTYSTNITLWTISIARTSFVMSVIQLRWSKTKEWIACNTAYRTWELVRIVTIFRFLSMFIQLRKCFVLRFEFDWFVWMKMGNERVSKKFCHISSLGYLSAWEKDKILISIGKVVPWKKRFKKTFR